MLVVVALAAARPALATFTPQHTPANNADFTALTLATPSGLSCTWTGATSVRLDWTATGSTWADGHEVQRETNGGGLADYAAVSPRTTVTATDASASSPTSNTYGYVVQGKNNSWRSPGTSEVFSNTCAGAISTLVPGGTTAARLNQPEDVAVDSNGNLYIADKTNNRIRKVTASTGVISTFAGTGSSGSSGDTGPATSATLNQPWGVDVDSSGNVYIADYGNCKIREVTVANNIINTIAGTTCGFADGAATTVAKLNAPRDAAVASNGDVYVSDQNNQRIRKLSGGSVSTVAGNGTGGYNGDGSPATSYELWNPERIAMDSSGNVYIADAANHRVRKLAGTTISTYAGTGTAGYNGEGTATAKQISSPIGIAVDSSGNVYIGDSGNNRIRKVDTSGTPLISTIAGTGSTAYTGNGYPATGTGAANINTPYGVAVSSGGTVYFVDYGENIVRKISTASSRVFTAAAQPNVTGGYAGDNTAATTSEMTQPQRVYLDSSGNLYFPADQRIREWVAATGEVWTVAGNGTAGSGGDDGSALLANLSTPQGVAVASNGDIYIADTNNHKIRKVTASTGTISRFAGDGTACATSPCGDGGAATSAQLKNPYDVDLDSSGNVYIADTSTHTIRCVAAASVNSCGQTPATAGRIYRFAGTQLSAGFVDNVAATSGKLNTPYGLAVASNGDVFIGDGINDRIRKVTASTGNISTFAGNGSNCTVSPCGDGGAATLAQMTLPSDVALTSSNVYIVDWWDHGIRKVPIGGGNISTVAGTLLSSGNSGDGGPATSAQLTFPFGVAVDASGNLYIPHTAGNGPIRKVVGPV